MEKSKTLAWLCIKTFIVYLFIMGLIYGGIVLLSDHMWSMINVTAEDFTEYAEYIRNDNFQQIPMKKFKNCSYIVFTENGEAIYTSSEDLKVQIAMDDIAFIPDINEDYTYSVMRDADDDSWWIFREIYDSESGETETLAYFHLDKDFNVLEGNLLEDTEQMSRREIELLQGIDNGSYGIKKIQYVNNYEEKRTIIFRYPLPTVEETNRITKEINILYALLLAAAILGLGAVYAVLAGKIRWSIHPLNEIVNKYRESGKYEQPDEKNIMKEYGYIYESTEQLILSLEQSKAAQLEQEKEKNRMIMNLSHDLKTPLTVIQGYAQALETGKVPKEDISRYLQVLRKKSDLSVSMINELMKYSTMEHPDYQIQRVRKDICEVCRSYLVDRYEEIENAGMELEVEFPEDPVYFDVDDRIFSNIFENLVNNTLKYNSAGTLIFVDMYEDLNDLVIEYADDGVGISDEIRNSVFKPFVMGDQARTSGKGTGIGMSIVKKGVELHGGTIVLLDSKGSRFSTVFEMRFPKQKNY